MDENIKKITHMAGPNLKTIIEQVSHFLIDFSQSNKVVKHAFVTKA
jgi:hypothetical protein